MKFKFKVQQYQTDAVNAVTRVFVGQGYHDKINYIRDIGKIDKSANKQMSLNEKGEVEDEYDDTGYKNEVIEISDAQILKNIQAVQQENDIKQSAEIVKDLGRCSLDVEMETGTGKTYVYIKTMFELNKLYGWSKFIVVVPSIAIREGVYKSFQITSDHFMEHYKKKANFFIYNSSNLDQLDDFSKNTGINVMIINTQAFAASLKENGRSKESRIIYSERDNFGSRRPIDVIKANRPIIILDEPQKMGKKDSETKKALARFNPLFTINYSATHKEHHNEVYSLDALDAYNKKLVKKIEVKGFELKNLKGTNSYLYLNRIVTSTNKAPEAYIDLEIKGNSGPKRKTRKICVGDDLYYKSNEMAQYKGYVVSEINTDTDTVSFTNGVAIQIREAIGDIVEKDMRRIQIRETIISHFKKEEENFKLGIKTLSLFFIDEVAKYRQYDEEGNEVLGEYGKIFEQEYTDILNEYINLENTGYQKYLKEMCGDVSKVHQGYFSIDKNRHYIDSKLKKGSDESDDISAYDLILKDKERLLSFDEPTRFIFSHSALREGWDNPNVFQICTLKHSDSETGKRQEVGRGLRICVDKDGNRMDAQSCGPKFHDINTLTVIPSDSYQSFVAELQDEIGKALRTNRPTTVTEKYFEGKQIKIDGINTEIDNHAARLIYRYLIKNDYIDEDNKVTQEYRTDVENDTLVPLPLELQNMSEGIHNLIQAVYDDKILREIVKEAPKSDNEIKVNDNFYKKEFQALWKEINHKYAYTVKFDSSELIQKAIARINDTLYVTQLQYTTKVGSQKSQMDETELKSGRSFGDEKTKTNTLEYHETSSIKYDLIGDIAKGAVLTRRTAAAILKGLDIKKFYMFKNNPEEFITKVINIIKEEKANRIVEHISYNQIDDEYDEEIFTMHKSNQNLNKAFKSNKAIQDYVFTDGTAVENNEMRFAKDLDAASEVCVYAKLPRTFHIPTPVGNYSPDWAIAFNEGTVKHIFFIAETKGSMDSFELRDIETAKINCASKLFNKISTGNIVYDMVDSYQTLLDKIK